MMMLNYLWNKATFHLRSQDGLGTVEILIILVVLVGIAFLFKNTIEGIVKGLMDRLQELFEQN